MKKTILSKTEQIRYTITRLYLLIEDNEHLYSKEELNNILQHIQKASDNINYLEKQFINYKNDSGNSPYKT